LGECDQNNDGFETFDLTSTIGEILNGLDSLAYTVVFFTSESDAQNETGAIPNPTAYINTTSPQTIYVRVFENANPNPIIKTIVNIMVGKIDVEFSKYVKNALYSISL
jgi:hypothetical protein